MQHRELPARPNLDHLRHEARALLKAYRSAETAAVNRVSALFPADSTLRLAQAQLVVAREYGFSSWAKLRAHVVASNNAGTDAEARFLAAVHEQDLAACQRVIDAHPDLANSSMHVAAALGDEAAVRRLLRSDPGAIRRRQGKPSGEPLQWLAYSPYHGESAARDDALAHTAEVLLEAGADPNTRDDQYGVPVLYAVTGFRSVVRIARRLLEAGALPTDGESVYHAAEHYHLDALELLREYRVELNTVGDWGNTPLFFLLRYHDVADEPSVKQGMLWLLEHGADPNVMCGPERESSLHLAIRRRQHVDIIRILIERGGNVNLVSGKGFTPWQLAHRAGTDDVAKMLERAGAIPVIPSQEDELVAACMRGDARRASALATPALIATLSDSTRQILPEAAARENLAVVQACLAAGFHVDTVDEINSTALHRAGIEGNAEIVEELLRRGASTTIRDTEHNATPLGWTIFGSSIDRNPKADYEKTVDLMLRAGARLESHHHSSHAGVAALIARWTAPSQRDAD